ncbi:LuxR C-terminal-related transcriptional regulator [Flavobacterium sp. N1994]|uniref:LuxR C-terminal-related transcriptional regulator n=1 Tax=Flavobacterium sp. N1994 TaxID=2986827 RepID=UPI00222386F1|nr:LuxR C-terminal-related transcriptional regulator [Flavobacterium sp. N1994]
MDKLIFDNVKNIWYQPHHNRTEKKLLLELNLSKKLLNFFQVGEYYFYILNLIDVRFEFLSPEFTKLMGYDIADLTVEKVFSYIHPDDLGYFIEYENTVAEFFKQLPSHKIQKYKVRYDFRLKKANGEYVRILQQAITIDHTEEGRLLRVLVSHSDITFLKKGNKSSLCFIGLEGEPSFLDVDIIKVAFLPNKNLLTKREKEIINYLAIGYSSKLIGTELGITKNTVDTHRKNILKKTDCKSVAELIAKAIDKGWM